MTCYHEEVIGVIPSPPRYPLIEAAIDVNTERHAGFTLVVPPCGPGFMSPVCINEDTPAPFSQKPCGEGTSILDFCPFVMGVSVRCNTLHPIGELYSWLDPLLETYKHFHIERYLWSGQFYHFESDTYAALGGCCEDKDCCQPFGLVDTSGDCDCPDPVSGPQALGYLEQQGYLQGGGHVIHLEVFAATVLMGQGLIVERDGRLYTVMGTPVIAGGGYTGYGPGNVAPDPGQSWAYVTGPVYYDLGPAFNNPEDPKDAVSHRTNAIEIRREQVATVGFDNCVHCAVLIDLTCCC